jgi:beta-glucosidase
LVASVPSSFLLAEFTGGKLSAMLSNSIIAAGILLTGAVSGQDTSPPKYPAPWINSDFNWKDPSPVPTNGRTWVEAYDKAVQFVSKLTLLEKVNLTTGVGWEGGKCVGNTGSIPRLGFPGLCNQDSPLGVRDCKFILPANWHEQC